MPIYKQTTEITNIDDLLSSVERDIEEVYFGDKQVFTVWAEYDGTLPAQYSANGDYLADYRIYGSAGGVGDDSGTAYGYEVDMATKSRNIMPSAAAEVKTENGITISCDGEGRYHISGTAAIQTFIKFDIPQFTIPTSVGAGGNGTFSMFNNFSNSHIVLFLYNSDYPIDSWVCTPSNRTHTAYNLMSGKMCNKIRFQVDEGTSVNGVVAPMFTEDGTLPTIYQPRSNITTPIYIGSSPLNAYEYIDYASGKIIRRTDNLVPPAPAFETTDRGITISTDGDGVYRISGTAESSVQIELPTPQFSEPLSVAEGGNGAMNFFNTPMNGVAVEMKYENNNVRRIELSSSYESAAYTYVGNTVQNVYVIITGGQTVNGTFSLMITDTGSIPQTYDPYVAPVDPPVPLPALPTVDGVNIVDYAGQSAEFPSRFTAKYRKEGF